MDITTIIGWVLGIGVLVFGIMYDKGDPENGVAAQMIVDNLFNFIDVPQYRRGVGRMYQRPDGGLPP